MKDSDRGLVPDRGPLPRTEPSHNEGRFHCPPKTQFLSVYMRLYIRFDEYKMFNQQVTNT